MWNGVHECWLRVWFDSRHAMQIWLDSCNTGTQACRIDLQAFHDPLNVIARLGQWDALHPINRINFGIARIAVFGHPLPNPTAPSVVSCKRHDIRASVLLKQSTYLGDTHLSVVNGIGYKT